MPHMPLAAPLAILQGSPADDQGVFLLIGFSICVGASAPESASGQLITLNFGHAIHEEVLPAEEGTMLRDAAFLVLAIVPMNGDLASNAVLSSLLYGRLFALGHLINNKY